MSRFLLFAIFGLTLLTGCARAGELRSHLESRVPMGPEAAQQASVTRAADVFALSLLAWEILTKERPFDPPAVLQALAGHTIPRVTLPMTLALDLELASAIEHGLAADPGERPTAAELERILRIVTERQAKAIAPP